jgi:hypothetical protein
MSQCQDITSENKVLCDEGLTGDYYWIFCCQSLKIAGNNQVHVHVTSLKNKQIEEKKHFYGLKSFI